MIKIDNIQRLIEKQHKLPKYYEIYSSIVGINQIPLWVHLNFPPLRETSSQGPKPNHAHIARMVWL